MPHTKKTIRIKEALWLVPKNGVFALFDSNGNQINGIRNIEVKTGIDQRIGLAFIEAMVNVADMEEVLEVTNVSTPKIINTTYDTLSVTLSTGEIIYFKRLYPS